MVTKVISNITEGSAFGDIIDPEIKSVKGLEQNAKKPTFFKPVLYNQRIKEEQQIRFMELSKCQICSGFGSAYLILMKTIFKR